MQRRQVVTHNLQQHGLAINRANKHKHFTGAKNEAKAADDVTVESKGSGVEQVIAEFSDLESVLAFAQDKPESITDTPVESIFESTTKVTERSGIERQFTESVESDDNTDNNIASEPSGSASTEQAVSQLAPTKKSSRQTVATSKNRTSKTSTKQNK